MVLSTTLKRDYKCLIRCVIMSLGHNETRKDVAMLVFSRERFGVMLSSFLLHVCSVFAQLIC